MFLSARRVMIGYRIASDQQRLDPEAGRRCRRHRRPTLSQLSSLPKGGELWDL